MVVDEEEADYLEEEDCLEGDSEADCSEVWDWLVMLE